MSRSQTPELAFTQSGLHAESQAAGSVVLYWASTLFYASMLTVLVVLEGVLYVVRRTMSIAVAPLYLLYGIYSWIWSTFILPLAFLGAGAGFVGVLIGTILGAAGVHLGIFGTHRQTIKSSPRSNHHDGGRRQPSTSHSTSTGSSAKASIPERYSTSPKPHEESENGSIRSSLDFNDWDWTDEEDDRLFSSGEEDQYSRPTSQNTSLQGSHSGTADKPIRSVPTYPKTRRTSREFYAQFGPKTVEDLTSPYVLYEDDDGYVTPALTPSRRPSIIFSPIYEEEEAVA